MARSHIKHWHDEWENTTACATCRYKAMRFASKESLYDALVESQEAQLRQARIIGDYRRTASDLTRLVDELDLQLREERSRPVPKSPWLKRLYLWMGSNFYWFGQP